MSLRVFELPEIAEILDLDPIKAKNWTNGRTGFVLQPSVRPASGSGKSALYNLQDLYLMAVAAEFSRSGFASRAINKLADTVKPKLTRPVASDTVWTVSRARAGGPFQIQIGQHKPAKSTFWHTLEIGPLLKNVDEAVAAFEERREQEAKTRKRKRLKK